MRKDRGNIILTALFVSIFLFFLSVALLWANRQDIALSLSMEHKLKAQAEARSLAMQAYGELKELGELQMPYEHTSDSGVESRVQLVRTPAAENRGPLMLVRIRSTSGPVSAYYTLYLQEVSMTSEEITDPVFFFPNGETSGAVYADFKYTQLSTSLSGKLLASNGPLIRSEQAQNPDQPYFSDKIPVFQGTTAKAEGPVLTVLPKVTDGTQLSWLKNSGDQFQWEAIPFPERLGQNETVPEGGAGLELSVTGNWTGIGLYGEDAEIGAYAWDGDPPADSVEDIETSLRLLGRFQAGVLKDWSEVQTPPVQEWFVTQGAVAAQQQDIYSYAWHYLYLPYSGSDQDQPSPLTGSRVVRWPCVLKYTLGSDTWEKVWAPLQESGQLRTARQPDLNVLLVAQNGTLYSLLEGQRELVTLENNDIKTGPSVPPGSLFVYRNEPWVCTPEGKLVCVTSDQEINFTSLPHKVPGVAGPSLDIPQQESLEIDEAGTVDLTPEGALEWTGTVERTSFPEYEILYSLSGVPKVIGNDLIALVEIELLENAVAEFINPQFIKDNRWNGGTTLARYDGTRWHIMPLGLRAFLDRKRHEPPPQEGVTPPPGDTLEPPEGANSLVPCVYTGLTKKLNRYAILSIDTLPFEFQNE